MVVVVLSERGGKKGNVRFSSLGRAFGFLKFGLLMLYDELEAGFECLYEIEAGWRTAGFDGSCCTFDLKVDLWSVFSEGLNQWISCLSRALQRKGGTGMYKKVKCSIPIECKIL